MKQPWSDASPPVPLPLPPPSLEAAVVRRLAHCVEAEVGADGVAARVAVVDVDAGPRHCSGGRGGSSGVGMEGLPQCLTVVIPTPSLEGLRHSRCLPPRLTVEVDVALDLPPHASLLK